MCFCQLQSIMSRVKSYTVQWVQKDVFLPVVEHYVKSEVLYCPVSAERCVFASCRALCQEWSLILSSECRKMCFCQLQSIMSRVKSYTVQWVQKDVFLPVAEHYVKSEVLYCPVSAERCVFASCRALCQEWSLILSSECRKMCFCQLQSIMSRVKSYTVQWVQKDVFLPVVEHYVKSEVLYCPVSAERCVFASCRALCQEWSLILSSECRKMCFCQLQSIMSRVKSYTVQWVQKDVFLPVVEHYVRSEVLYCPVSAERCVFASCRALCQEWSLILSSECRKMCFCQLQSIMSRVKSYTVQWVQKDVFLPVVEHYVKSEVLYCPVSAERCVFASCRALCQEWSLILSSECRKMCFCQL